MNRIILIGCVKTKLPQEDFPNGAAFVEAKSLYRSPLFDRRRAHAEASGHPWGIISAFYGVVAPDDPMHSYEQTIAERDVDAWNRRVWIGLWHFARRVEGQRDHRPLLPPMVLEVHAGRPYVDALNDWLGKHGQWTEQVRVEHPVKGLQIGEQLAFYDRPTELVQLELRGVA